MRKLNYFTMVSLDGFIEAPGHNIDWIVMDEELHSYVNNLSRETGADLYGRRMYELMQSYWPTADTQSDQPVEVEFSRIWKQIPKIVFSSTLEKVEGNARLSKEDPVEEVTRLKAQPGKDLEVGGSELASALMRAGLVDEYRIFVNPVILGEGTPMIPALDRLVNLQLLESHTFSNGVVYLHYRRKE